MDRLLVGGLAGVAGVSGPGGQDDVIEGQEEVVAEVLGSLSDVADRDGIGTDLALRKNRPDLHAGLLLLAALLPAGRQRVQGAPPLHPPADGDPGHPDGLGDANRPGDVTPRQRRSGNAMAVSTTAGHARFPPSPCPPAQPKTGPQASPRPFIVGQRGRFIRPLTILVDSAGPTSSAG